MFLPDLLQIMDYTQIHRNMFYILKLRSWGFHKHKYFHLRTNICNVREWEINGILHHTWTLNQWKPIILTGDTLKHIPLPRLKNVEKSQKKRIKIWVAEPHFLLLCPIYHFVTLQISSVPQYFWIDIAVCKIAFLNWGKLSIFTKCWTCMDSIPFVWMEQRQDCSDVIFGQFLSFSVDS